MIYLLLAVLSSASLSIIMRVSEKSIKNNISLLLMNYFTCLFISLLSLNNNIYLYDFDFNISFLLGIINGFLYLYSFALFQINISYNGVILSSLFMKLGVLIPTLLSILLFKETPKLSQIIGFFIAIISIVFMNYKKDNKQTKHFSLLFLLIISGLTDFMAKIYDQIGKQGYSNYFLFFTFLFAFLFCFLYMLSKKQKITINEIIFGFFIGIPNYFSAKFLLLSLRSLPAMIVYPMYSVCTIIVVSILGMLLFKESLSKKQLISFICILFSLLLLHL